MSASTSVAMIRPQPQPDVAPDRQTEEPTACEESGATPAMVRRSSGPEPMISLLTVVGSIAIAPTSALEPSRSPWSAARPITLP
jgi:hypothetical protein